VDDTALANSELRAQSLTTIEMKAICGAAPVCVDSLYEWSVSAPDCPAGASPFCATARAALLRVMGSGTGTSGKTILVPAPVIASVWLGNTSEIDQYRGGRLHGLFLQQYGAFLILWKELERALATAESTTGQIAVADAELSAASAEYDQVQAEINAAYAQLEGQVAGLTAQKQIYLSNAATAQAQRNAALIEKVRQCSDQAFKDAENAGFSFSGEHITLSTTLVWGVESESWSNGPLAAQYARCNDAIANFNIMEASLNQQRDAMQEMADALQVQVDAFNLQYQALPRRLATAWARNHVAFVRTGTVRKEQSTQMATAYLAVQSAFNQMLMAGAAIDQTFAEAWLIWGRNKVEETLQGYDIRTRFGVRKRFRSYDLWRARALSENARRLAVAARRAIESRYVVNLSKLAAPEAFVAAPALWADEIYSSDLKPPVALGLEKSPSTSSGIYTNKLVDYVNNLKLFVDGYSVSRPTAVVRSDAEVIQLPGPAAEVRQTSYDASFTMIDPESTGWLFFCEETGTWISHPNLASFTETAPNWGLSTACNGKPPTLARTGFSLDPWGRLKGNVFEPPFEDRHNVRWGDLAVNLVGTGIRDCSKAVDANACYAEPFIRYDVQHVGAVWVTDFDQAWRSLDIPTAIIEGGKALAAEEWLDPVTNGFNRPDVHNVQRAELGGRPLGGMYSLTLRLSPEIRVERIERIQLLLETKYWVRQR
jgi:hypothetical protein